MKSNDEDIAVFELNRKTGEFLFSDSCSRYELSKLNNYDVYCNSENRNVIYQDDIDVSNDFFEKMCSHGDSISVELRLKLTDGKYCWCRIVGTFREDDDDNSDRTIGIIIDIDKKKRENEVKDNLLNKIPVGIGIFEIVDGVTHQKYMNQGFYDLVQDDRESRNNKHNGDFIQVIHEQDRKNVINAIENVKNGSDYEVAVCRAITGDEKIAWIRLIASVGERRDNFTRVYCSYTSMAHEIAARNDLEQNNKLLSKALDVSHMGVWEYDSNNRIIVQTEGNIKLTGYDRKIIKDVPESMIAAGYVKEEFIDSYRAFFNEFNTSRKAISADFQVKNWETSKYWWEHVSLTPILDDTGELIKGIGTSVDISEQKELQRLYQQQIHEMEELDSDNLIAKGRHNLSKNRTLYYQHIDYNAVDIFKDYEYDLALNKLVDSALAEDDRKLIKNTLNRKELIHKIKSGVENGSFIYYRKCDEESPIWCEVKYIISEEPDTKDIIVFLYSYNVTEQVLGEQIIKKISSLEYDVLGIIDIASGRYSLKNTNNDNKQCSPEILENTIDQGRKFILNGVDINDRKFVSASMEIVNIVKQLERVELFAFSYFANEAGQLKRKQFQFSYLDNTHTSILFCRSDITETYRQEQERLMTTQKALMEAKRANEAKTDFLSRMSHDIRTPMNAIIGMTKLAKEENNLSSIREYLDNIDSSSKFLLGLINDILDLSKIESGQFELNKEPYDLDEFNMAINTVIRPLMESKNINFVYDVKNSVDSLMVDKLRFNQIFFNLLSNAAKFTPSGGTVTFSINRVPDKDGEYGGRYTVSDTGIGMSKEFMAHMFEPFSQEHLQGNEFGIGTGLGLPIVKSLVDAMGGTISVSSELGKGTIYNVEIHSKVVHRKKYDETEEIMECDISGTRVLLVEDNEMNILVASKLLEKKGCIVTVAKNGEEAVELFSKSQAETFQIILMDVRMPVMNGLEATKVIRTLGKDDAASVPIIAMTADAFAQEKKKTIEAGMNCHLSKPIDPLMLYDTINKYVNK